MVKFSFLDDSPGEEIALLMMILAATTVATAPPQKAETPSCRADVILVSKTFEPSPERQEQQHLPRDKAGAKGPTVLTPGCKPDERRKKEYPMA
jgi:hypothetical protein